MQQDRPPALGPSEPTNLYEGVFASHGVTKHEAGGEQSDGPHRQRRSKRKPEEVSGNDVVCSEAGDTAGQEENVEGSMACELQSSEEVSEDDMDEKDGLSAGSGFSQIDDDLYTVDQVWIGRVQ